MSNAFLKKVLCANLMPKKIHRSPIVGVDICERPFAAAPQRLGHPPFVGLLLGGIY